MELYVIQQYNKEYGWMPIYKYRVDLVFRSLRLAKIKCIEMETKDNHYDIFCNAKFVWCPKNP